MGVRLLPKVPQGGTRRREGMEGYACFSLHDNMDVLFVNSLIHLNGLTIYIGEISPGGKCFIYLGKNH